MLFHIDERDLRESLDQVCMVKDVFLWMKIQYSRTVDMTGNAANGAEETLKERERGVREVIRQIGQFSDEKCAHRLLRRMISDFLWWVGG